MVSFKQTEPTVLLAVHRFHKTNLANCIDKTEAEMLKTFKAMKAGKATSNILVKNVTHDDDDDLFTLSAVNTEN